MVDEHDKSERQRAARGDTARQDRLKLKLRENLKRRKLQAKERGKTPGEPSSDLKACPDGQVGKRGQSLE